MISFKFNCDFKGCKTHGEQNGSHVSIECDTIADAFDRLVEEDWTIMKTGKIYCPPHSVHAMARDDPSRQIFMKSYTRPLHIHRLFEKLFDEHDLRMTPIGIELKDGRETEIANYSIFAILHPLPAEDLSLVAKMFQKERWYDYNLIDEMAMDLNDIPSVKVSEIKSVQFFASNFPGAVDILDVIESAA